MKTILEIKDSFFNKLTILRNYYMSSLLENELANTQIEKNKYDSVSLESKYKNEENKFIFGRKDDGFLATEVEVNECIHMITSNKEKTKMLINLLIINLCSAFESFLIELFEYYLKSYPEHINNSQKQMKLQDVFKFNDFNELKEDLIVQEIKSYVFRSLEKQITDLEEHYKVKFGFSSESRAAKVIFIKRNCIVHNQSLVNKELFEMLTHEQKSRNSIGKPINTSEFEFSEEIHLLNIMGRRIVTTIQTEISEQSEKHKNLIT
ncbi:hypothetical protein [Paenibacillus taichungensis]|uniref:hypothetical protein n=1 Tax=Paenibacillus taichungensis TaxID=484184 RepID=UPI0039A4275D